MAACAILYLPSLAWALGLDQNIFAEIGALLLKGKKLYVDAWDVKPPNIFYLYAIFEWIFGQHEIAVRISDYCFSLLSCAAIFAATEQQSPMLAGRGKEWIAPVASVLLMLTLLSLGLADTAQTESYSLVFLIMASLLAQPISSAESRSHYPLRLFFSGVSIGVALFFKTSNLVFLIAIAAEVWIYNAHPRLKAIGILLVGCLAWSVVQLGVLAVSGSLVEYLRVSWSVLLHHTNEVSSLRATDVPRALWTYLDLWSVLAMFALLIAIIKKDSAFLRAALSPLLLLAAGIAAVLIQNKGWGYQFVVVLPGLTRLCAISGTYLYRMIHTRSAKIAGVVTVVLFIATLTLTPSAHRRMHYVSDALLSMRDRPAYLATLGSPHSLYYPPATDSLADYLVHNTSPTDKVFIFGEEPGAYWRADRLPATRYVYSLLFTSGVISNEDLLAMQDTLLANPPAIIVVERFDTTAFRGKPETSETLIANDSLFSIIRNIFFRNYYSSDTLCGSFIIHRHVLLTSSSP
ncbi:MAG TPA: hypothetical protein VGM92_01740 [Candidatus Kapabacteria bacterium]